MCHEHKRLHFNWQFIISDCLQTQNSKCPSSYGMFVRAKIARIVILILYGRMQITVMFS